MSTVPEEAENTKPSQFLVEALRASTRSLRFLFLLSLGLSFMVGYSIFQQPWWIIERVGSSIDTVEPIEQLHRDVRNEPALTSTAREKLEQLKAKALTLADAAARLQKEHPRDAEQLASLLESSLTDEQRDYLDDLLEEEAWGEVDEVINYISSKDSEQLSIDYLILFAGYLYPEFWEGLLDGTVTLLRQLDEHSQDLNSDYEVQGIVTATLGPSWYEDLERWDLGPRAVIRDAKLGLEWQDRLFGLPEFERLSRSMAVLVAFCDQYGMDDHCSLGRIRIELGEKADENVLRNLEVPYLGKSLGNLQIVLFFPFLSFTLVLMLYLQIRRRKVLLDKLAESQLQHEVMLMDAPTIFSNIELFGRSDTEREERAASLGLRLVVALTLGYALAVIAACIFYVGQEVYFDVILVQFADEFLSDLKPVGLSVSLPFMDFPWVELIAVIIWVLVAGAAGIMGTWTTWLIWRELSDTKGIRGKLA